MIIFIKGFKRSAAVKMNPLRNIDPIRFYIPKLIDAKHIPIID